MIRNSGLIKMKLISVFGEEFGQDVEPTSIITEYMKDEAFLEAMISKSRRVWLSKGKNAEYTKYFCIK